MRNQRKLSASCIVFKDDSVLLVKHTYGAAKGRYLIPGGFSEEGEMPQETAEREVLEETGILVQAKDLVAVRFTTQEIWCIFNSVYIEGMPISDCMENEEAIFMPIEEALNRGDVVETTKELIRQMLCAKKICLRKSAFVNLQFEKGKWQLFI